jgi:parallel beta-helix repeat protein
MVQSTLVATLYVDPVMGDDANSGTRANPYRTLTCALKATASAKMIQLAPGTCSSASGEVFPLVIPDGVTVLGNEATKGKGIFISGSGEYRSQGFGMQNITLLLQGNAQLIGVTLTNPMAKGTGVWIESASPTVANNTVTQCGREGVFVSETAKPTIRDNVFVQNTIAGLVMARHSQGEVLRNVVQKNSLGIAISDFAAPLVAHNKVSENSTGMAFSRKAHPVLRHNLIEKNIQDGLLVNGEAVPDLGNSQEPGGNIFRSNGQFDVRNITSKKLISVGNQLLNSQIRGLVELVRLPKNSVHSVSSKTIITDMTDHWATAFVEALLGKNLITLFPDGTFQPDTPITRAQYAVLVARAFHPVAKRQIPEFTDISKDYWAYDAIRIAAKSGFVSGFSNRTFRPEQPVLRLQVIVSLVSGLSLSAKFREDLVNYSDRNTIPKAALTAVATATHNKIIVNFPDPKLIQGNREASRAEVAAMVYQALVAIGTVSAIDSPYIVSLPRMEVE